METKLKIEGGKLLTGIIEIDGSKNAALALIPASLLAKNVVVLNNVPRINDVFDMLDILSILNVKYEFLGNTLTIDSSSIINKPLVDDCVRKIRASYYFIGALLSLFNEVTIAYPGGCKIGSRPIDFHINALEKTGVEVKQNDDILYFSYNYVTNTTIVFPFPSVGATINLILASAKRNNLIVLDNISCEPEVLQVIDFLNSCGAKIKRVDEKTLIIVGNDFSKCSEFNIMQDRIESGTYCILGALLGNKLTIKNAGLKYLQSLLLLLKQVGIIYRINNDSITFYQSKRKKTFSISTAPYPLFPTDLQQPLCVLASFIPGISYIYEGIYFDRKKHIKELNKLGCKIKSFNNKIIIEGPSRLKGTSVEAYDLRGGASLVVAALNAEGTTLISGVEYINRGYSNFIEKLQKVGATICLEDNNEKENNNGI